MLSLSLKVNSISPVSYNVENMDVVAKLPDLSRVCFYHFFYILFISLLLTTLVFQATYAHFSSDGKLVFAHSSGLPSIEICDPYTGKVLRSLNNGIDVRIDNSKLFNLI